MAKQNTDKWLGNTEICRSPVHRENFRRLFYPLNVAMLFEDSPVRMKRALTYNHMMDILATATHHGTIAAFSVASIKHYDTCPPLTFYIDQIRKANKIGETLIRKCTMTCPQLQWEIRDLDMVQLAEHVEKRLWLHVKNTHPELFATFLSQSQSD